jgi:hypothetical protein
MSDSSRQDHIVEPTIVGGRPLGKGRSQHGIPRGIEALVKKAAVDLSFRGLLLEKRAKVASEIGLELSAAETSILNSLPEPQIEQIIDNTTVPDEHRRVFLGKMAAAMLAVLTLPLSASAWQFLLGGVCRDFPYGVRVPPEHERLNVEIVEQGENAVTVKCNYDCPFDSAELRLIFGRDLRRPNAVVTCRPDRTAASIGAGEAVFSVEGKGGTTCELLLRMNRSTKECEEVARNHTTHTDLEANLWQFRPGEYVVGDCVIYKLLKFWKIWPS